MTKLAPDAMVKKILKTISDDNSNIYSSGKYLLGNQPSDPKKVIQGYKFNSKELLNALKMNNISVKDGFRLNWICNGINTDKYKQCGKGFDLIETLLCQGITNKTPSPSDNTVFTVEMNANGNVIDAVSSYIMFNAITTAQKITSAGGDPKPAKKKVKHSLDIAAASPCVCIDLGEYVDVGLKGKILLAICEDASKEVNKSTQKQTATKDSERKSPFKRFAVCPGISKLKECNQYMYPVLHILRDYITRTKFSIWVHNDINWNYMNLNVKVTIKRNSKEYSEIRQLYNETVGTIPNIDDIKFEKESTIFLDEKEQYNISNSNFKMTFDYDNYSNMDNTSPHNSKYVTDPIFIPNNDEDKPMNIVMDYNDILCPTIGNFQLKRNHCNDVFARPKKKARYTVNTFDDNNNNYGYNNNNNNNSNYNISVDGDNSNDLNSKKRDIFPDFLRNGQYF